MMATACRRQVRCAQGMCHAMTTWQQSVAYHLMLCSCKVPASTATAHILGKRTFSACIEPSEAEQRVGSAAVAAACTRRWQVGTHRGSAGPEKQDTTCCVDLTVPEATVLQSSARPHPPQHAECIRPAGKAGACCTRSPQLAPQEKVLRCRHPHP